MSEPEPFWDAGVFERATEVGAELNAMYAGTGGNRDYRQVRIDALFAEMGVDRRSLAGCVMSVLLADISGMDNALKVARTDPEEFRRLVAAASS